MDVQRPLYGLATDLTPFAVVGPVTGASSSSAPRSAVPSAVRSTATATASATRLRATAQPRVPASGREKSPGIKVATIAIGAVLVVMWFNPTTGPTRSAVTSVQEAPVERAPLASRGETSVAVKVEAKPIVLAPKAQRAAKRASQTTPSSPNELSQSRLEPSDADLAATLERLRGGMR